MPETIGFSQIVDDSTGRAVRPDQPRRAAMRPAARCARPMIVSIGLTPEAVGNTEASVTNRPRTSWVSWSGPTTELDRSVPSRHEPIWWYEKKVTRPPRYPAPRMAAAHVSGAPGWSG